MADPRVEEAGEGNSNGDKGKRKLVFPSGTSMDIPPLSRSDLKRFEVLAESLRQTMIELKSRKQSNAKQEIEEEKSQDSQQSEWDDPMALHLEKLLISQLRESIQTAIKKIVERGYTEELAEWAVLTSGLYVGSKDIISNIVGGALALLINNPRKNFDTSERFVFESVESLADFALLEMVNVLREVKPNLTVAEAMWQLLISDLNLLHARALEGDTLNQSSNQEKETLNLKCPCCTKLSEMQGTSSGEKSGAAGKGTLVYSRKDLLLQKTPQSVGASGVKKNKNSKSKAAAVLKQESKPGNSIPASSSAVAENNGDDVLYVEKDELIVKLKRRKQQLEKEVQGWTDWTNVKIREAAQKLSKNQAELKMLKQERQDEPDKSQKRISEVEAAIYKVEGQIEAANSVLRRLDADHTMLKKGLADSKLKSANSSKNLQEAKLREKEVLKQSQKLEAEMSVLQEQLAALKGKSANLQAQIEKARKRQHEFEVLRQHEEREKTKFLRKAESIERERRQMMHQAKVEEDNLRAKAEANRLIFEERMKKLNAEISALKLKREAAKVEAVKRERECVMCLTEEKSIVFLPCAHQVLCKECNVLHENKGMNDCPICRTPIVKRIIARFVPPKAH